MHIPFRPQEPLENKAANPFQNQDNFAFFNTDPNGKIRSTEKQHITYQRSAGRKLINPVRRTFVIETETTDSIIIRQGKNWGVSTSEALERIVSEWDKGNFIGG